MTKILIDRSVVEQAVKALENRESTPVEYDTYHALRAALDQPPSSYPLPDELYDSKDWRAGGYAERVEWLHTMYESAKEQIAALCAALEPQVEQEPVAWIEHEWSGSGLRQLHFERPAPTVRDEVVRPVWTPLYTHPQQPRQPQPSEQGANMLTPELIHKLALEAGAARFYPEQQSVKQELYLVSQGFLEKFTELVEKHKLEQELDQKYPLEIGTRS